MILKSTSRKLCIEVFGVVICLSVESNTNCFFISFYVKNSEESLSFEKSFRLFDMALI